jgi:hypothetical protein
VNVFNSPSYLPPVERRERSSSLPLFLISFLPRHSSSLNDAQLFLSSSTLSFRASSSLISPFLTCLLQYSSSSFLASSTCQSFFNRVFVESIPSVPIKAVKHSQSHTLSHSKTLLGTTPDVTHPILTLVPPSSYSLQSLIPLAPVVLHSILTQPHLTTSSHLLPSQSSLYHCTLHSIPFPFIARNIHPHRSTN